MQQPAFLLPQSGPYTLSLDWAEHMAAQGDDRTLGGAAWTLPAGFTNGGASIAGSKAIITLNFSELAKNSTHTLLCAATFSNGDTHTAELQVLIKNLAVQQA